MDISSQNSARPERSRGASAPTHHIRPSTPLGTSEGGTDPKRVELKAAAKAFEAVFVRQMIGSMRQASLGDELFGSSAADQFRDMQDAKLADEMADDGSFGIADMLLRQFDQQGLLGKESAAK